MRYQRLSAGEREEISVLLPLGVSKREIGRRLGRSASTIVREIRRCRTYRGYQAHQKALRAASGRRKHKRILFQNRRLRTLVHSRLRRFHSPEQIANDLKTTYPSEMQISKESIYTYVYVLPRGRLKKELIEGLRRQHKKRRIRGQSQKGQSAHLEDMLSIEERPKEVAHRCIPGHWEGDIIIGDGRRQTALGTLVERTTRYLILVPLKNKTAEEVRTAFTREVKKIPQFLRKSMTYDQGREMAQHKLFTQDTKMKVYFAHPRSPWERGTNENTNGLLRQYFPKGTNFTALPRSVIKKAQHSMNHRPRKTLQWKTPNEAFRSLLQ